MGCNSVRIVGPLGLAFDKWKALKTVFQRLECLKYNKLSWKYIVSVKLDTNVEYFLLQRAGEKVVIWKITF